MSEMKGGWFIGDFEPSVLRTTEFEAGHKFHYKGEIYKAHIHQVATEINFLLRGQIKIQGQIMNTGDIIVIEPGDLSDPEFLEDCDFFVIKVPSVIGDKYEV